MKKAVVIKQSEKEVPTEVMADCIVQISAAVKKLRAGRLTDSALYLLIQHAAPSIGHKPISMKTIRAVIDGISSLETTFLKKRP